MSFVSMIASANARLPPWSGTCNYRQVTMDTRYADGLHAYRCNTIASRVTLVTRGFLVTSLDRPLHSAGQAADPAAPCVTSVMYLPRHERNEERIEGV
jgi:hypothetical protein